MHVILTNDDGVDSPGLAVLRHALIDAGISVTVVAPDGNRSARGHSITCREPLTVRRHTSERTDDPIFSCSGTPADCARIGVLGTGLWPTADIVVSGINIGINLGDDLNYSGTFHAAVEAALLGVPAVAFSQQPETGGAPFINHSEHHYRYGAYAARLVSVVAKSAVPERAVLNVNLPNDAHPGQQAVSTIPGRRYYDAPIEAMRTDDHTWQFRPFATGDFPEPRFDDAAETDFGALISGRASVSGLRVPGFSDKEIVDWVRTVTDAAGPVDH